MNISKKSIKGGYTFRGFQGEPGARVYSCKSPGNVTVLLKQGFGEEVPSLVKVQDSVQKGQIIGRSDDTVSNPVHSPLTGQVEMIKKINLPSGPVKAVCISGDAGIKEITLPGYSLNWQNLSDEKIEELIYLSGAGAGGTCGIPTRFKSSLINPEDVDDIIVSHIAADVFNLPPDVLLGGEGLSQFTGGLAILKKIMPAARLHLVMDKSGLQWLNQTASQAAGLSLNLHMIEAKYPAQLDQILIPAILNKSFPHGYSAAHIGVISLDIQDLLHVYNAVALGQPVLERTVALSGPGLTENGSCRVLIGTSLEEITRDRTVQGKQLRFIFNSPLLGEPAEDLTLPVSRNCSQIISLEHNTEGEIFGFARPGFRKDSLSNTFLAKLLPFKKTVDTNLHGEKRACLSCGNCSDVCPSRILPQLLHKYVQKNIIEESMVQYRIGSCIECNLCTYVCTSKIDLAELIRKGKTALKKEGYDIHADLNKGVQFKVPPGGSDAGRENI